MNKCIYWTSILCNVKINRALSIGCQYAHEVCICYAIFFLEGKILLTNLEATKTKQWLCSWHQLEFLSWVLNTPLSKNKSYDPKGHNEHKLKDKYNFKIGRYCINSLEYHPPHEKTPSWRGFVCALCLRQLLCIGDRFCPAAPPNRYHSSSNPHWTLHCHGHQTPVIHEVL